MSWLLPPPLMLSMQSVNFFVNQRSYTALELLELCQLVLQRGGQLDLQVHGRSMHPLLPDGAIVRLRPLEPPLTLGTIVLANVGQHIVLHRVLRRHQHTILVAGDANQYVDGWLPLAAVVGQVSMWSVNGKQYQWTTRHRWFGWSMAVLRHTRRWIRRKGRYA